MDHARGLRIKGARVKECIRWVLQESSWPSPLKTVQNQANRGRNAEKQSLTGSGTCLCRSCRRLCRRVGACCRTIFGDCTASKVRSGNRSRFGLGTPVHWVPTFSERGHDSSARASTHRRVHVRPPRPALGESSPAHHGPAFFFHCCHFFKNFGSRVA